MTITSRPYRTDADLRRMQALVSESWRREKPHVAQHIGDLDWWMWQYEGLDPTKLVRLWFDAPDELVGWAWLTPPAELDFQIHPDHRDVGLLEQMLSWLAGCARERAASGATVSELSVWALEADAASVAVLQRNGYQRSDQSFLHMVRHIEGDIPAPALPEGFVVRPVRGEEELAARVAVHWAAFAPSRVTEESYRNVMRSNAYRSELDMAVVTPDGTFAAYCLCWLDEENQVGEFEPVGAHPDYQRQGFARAACLAALKQLRSLGADSAIVYQTGQNEASARLYDSLGFREITKLWRFAAPFSRGVQQRSRPSRPRTTEGTP